MLKHWRKRFSQWCSCEQSSGTSLIEDSGFADVVRCNDCGKLITVFETMIVGRVAPCSHEHFRVYEGYPGHFYIRCDDCGSVMSSPRSRA